MPYRPPLKFQKAKQTPIPIRGTSVFDLAKGFNQIGALAQELEILKTEYEKSIKEIEENTKNTSRKTCDTLTKTFAGEFNKIIERAYEVMASIKKGDKGDAYILTASDKKEIVEAIKVPVVEKVIERTEVVKYEKPVVTNVVTKETKETAEQVAEKLNTLKEAVEQEVIKGLVQTFKKLEQEIHHLSSKIAQGGGSGGGGGSWHQVALVGTIDGINTSYTFAGVKPSQYSERVFLNYVEQNPVNGDYTINYETQTVTYAVAPSALLSGFPHTIRYHS